MDAILLREGAINSYRKIVAPRRLLDFHRFFAFFAGFFAAGLVSHGGGALEFVPGEFLALDGSFDGLKQDDRKDLPVGETLQPNLTEKPSVFAGFGLATLESERNRGGDEIDDQKDAKEDNKAGEAGRIGGIRVEILLHKIPERADDEHDVNEGRHEGQQNLKDDDVGQCDPTERAFSGECGPVLPNGLQNAE